MGELMGWTRAVGACIFFVTVTAARAEPKVLLRASVVLASSHGTLIDPPELVRIKDLFDRQGLPFTSYKRLSTQTLELQKQKPINVLLPNQQTVSVLLVDLVGGTARIQIGVAQFARVVLALGRKGELFQHAGEFQGGHLMLVLSPLHPGKKL